MTAVPPNRSRRRHWLWVSLPITAVAVVFGASVGETVIPVSTVFRVLANKLSIADFDIGRIEEGIVWN
jgi:iron complex transport system permease protein